MQRKLFRVGILLSAASAFLSFVSLNLGADGLPSDVHPMGAVGVGVSALAFLYGSTCVPKESE
jgi:hypothetical protein